jgi:ATP-dependent Lhr-like helicase
LVECTALLDSVRRGELDHLTIPENALDVLAQQIVADTAAREWREDELFALVRCAWPYRNLPREDFNAVVAMLGEGYTTRRGRRGALIHYDAVNHELRGRRGARLTAITSGGTIPDNADYRVIMEPENVFIGTVNEDFAVESLQGDIFQLGNRSYQIMRVERGTVRVEDAHGKPPSIPFWLGEAPGRSDELSRSVSRLRQDFAERITNEAAAEGILGWLNDEIGISDAPARTLVDYLASAHAALGGLPTQDNLVFERFFDESGGMQLVIHSPYGSRLNRAWGLALRKRFCGKFNFELQAAATEDNIVLSLTAVHSFDLEAVKRYLHSSSVRDVLIQALLNAPMFMTRWRWVAGVALALPRFRGGRKVAPQLARMEAEDLVATIFPDQLACAENIVGDREIPDHPLVRQAIDDCVHEAMDLTGLQRLLAGLESGSIGVVTRDLTEPSPLALEVLSARPYAYLDDAPLEERRTQAVMGRRWLAPEQAAELGRLDVEAIERVRGEARPDPTNADELHDALVWLGFATAEEAQAPGWNDWLAKLARDRRVAQIRHGDALFWITAERSPQFRALWPDLIMTPTVEAPAAYAERAWSPDESLIEILRGRLEGLGPVTQETLAASLGMAPDSIVAALSALESEGFALRGRFNPDVTSDEWCERRLLARIHNYTVKRLRAEIEPVAARDFLRFLFKWQHVAPSTRMEGPDAVNAIIAQLEGFEAAAAAWEAEILPARIAEYEPSWLDDHCLAGRVSWARLRPRVSPANGSSRKAGPVRATPITLLPRRHAPLWAAISPIDESIQPSSRGQAVLTCIREQGALFFDELVDATGLLRQHVEEALAELVALGLVSSDSFGGLRALLVPADQRKPYGRGGRRRRTRVFGMEDAGRWALARRSRPAQAKGVADGEAVEHIARSLLRRYGVVFWRMLEREADWLPPWRDLLRIYRRLEARGDIRGGRFVSGFPGEQFALPEAVGMLREVRRKPGADEWIAVSGADPLNLAGILTPGPKLAALTGNRLLYRGDLPVAILTGGDVQFLQEMDVATEWDVRKALLRGRLPSSPADLSPDGSNQPDIPTRTLIDDNPADL